MQLATVALPDGATRAAVLQDGGWHALPAPDLSAFLRSGEPVRPGAELPGAVPVLPLPTPAKVLCCGLNYAEHIREMGHELPSHPTLFAKFADTLTGPSEDVVLPSGLRVDWEAELAVVVGATLRRADRATALAGIAGYTVANDVSVRDWQNRTSQWLQGKAWDGSCPLGPVLVTPDEVDPAAGLEVVCRVNGEEVQHASTKTLVFDPADLLAYVSAFTVLRPGDVVLTGTPGGVGAARDPQRFLADGDVLETSVSGIGTLRNTVRFTA
ncbi:fumarylacetoacetate hydrolase family protein [Kitasatospora cheerisanensis]|uniref:2-hydroxyhepta-2,4-diene-1,7-dioate isomerase n=1 Tax=Kitasatospora cheerisanensis KCTC 2395 TaxID=1348663 RepID=A0A066Z6K2_9ACTN|nr:fumarylacetoacetate hydrolase family protein [Kitasatospora cheerisanensis]KDN87869.1 2-hydroxyhepta-2,4-diene-1,7-dioate isomerase [Kitasatospora cheerisanensis KCTC 2395]